MASASAGTIPELRPMVLRMRHRVVIAGFILIVCLPVICAAVMSWRFAGTLQKVSISLTLQEQALGAFGDLDTGSALKAAFSGARAEEASIIRQLVQSEDFYRSVRDRVDLARIWPRSRIVPFLPLRYETAPVEKGFEFWRKMVRVHVGSRDGIIRLSVTGFRQEDAAMLLSAIRDEGEQRLNVARAVILSEALRNAQQRVRVLRAQYVKDSDRLRNFRLQSATIDPMLLARLNARFDNALRSMLATEEIRLAGSPLARASQSAPMRGEDRLSAITAQIEDAAEGSGRIIAPSDLALLIAAYQPVLTRAEMSGMSLRIAELSLLGLARQYESNRVFLTSVTGGAAISVESFPRFLPTVLIVSVSCIVLWAMLLIAFYAIRDRR
ncbi:hypothetical protein PAE61_12820 [Paracoccus aerodenitrificans]|nr:hypothetical protein PAE61_12820 [Paracoccus aerodenitrificans]